MVKNMESQKETQFRDLGVSHNSAPLGTLEICRGVGGDGGPH